MRVAFVSTSISRAGGGVAEAMRSLAQALVDRGDVIVDAIALRDEHSAAASNLWRPVRTTVCKPFGPRIFGYSSALRIELRKQNADLVHSHGIWQFPSAAVCAWRRTTGRAYIVSPHGMLDSWALRNSPWKKRLATLCYERRHLQGAACLHALNMAERDQIRRFGLTNPIAVIPNGVVLPSPIAEGIAGGEHKTLLFLGRIHAKKGLIPLLNAWAEIRSGWDNWRLVIAGWDDRGFEQTLRDEGRRLGLNSAVEFLSPQFGSDRDRLFRRASAFVLPSFSEGLPMAVLEAWSYGLPVLMTPQCNLLAGFERGAAISAEPKVESLIDGLRQLLGMSDVERRLMGAKGRALVEERFAWPHVAAQTAAVYRWMLGDGPRPDFVEAAI
jgi:poly(glycerol-phosphate) alpha-glucosyltransferase